MHCDANVISDVISWRVKLVIALLSSQVSIYLLLLQLTCCMEAYQVRYLPPHYNESKDIAITMFCTILTTLISLLFAYNYTHPRTRKLVHCATITITNFIILTLMYAKKTLRLLVGRDSVLLRRRPRLIVFRDSCRRLSRVWLSGRRSRSQSSS